MSREQAPGEDELPANAIDIGIVAAVALAVAFLEPQHLLAIAADLRQSASGLMVRPTIERPLQLREAVELLGIG